MTSPSPRQNFDRHIQLLFDLQNPEARALFIYIKRLLRQFRVGETYKVRDILVEAYVRGVRLTETGVEIDVPIAWIRRTALNIIRENRRELNKFKDWNIKREPCLKGTEVLSEEVHREDLQTLFIAYGKLEPEERYILYLRVIEEKSWSEIGQYLSQKEDVVYKENALRQRGFRALKKLRKIYEEEREIFSNVELKAEIFNLPSD